MIVTRFSTPRLIVRDVAQTLTFPVYEEDALSEPTSGTYTLYKGTTSTLTGAVVVASEVATFDVTAIALADASYDVDYHEDWDLLIDGQEYKFRRDVYVVRRDLYPVLTDQDLIRLHSDFALLMPSTMDSYGSYRDEAWDQILGRLIGLGNLPQLITNSWAFRTPHLWLTLHLICTDFSTEEAGTGKWTKLSEKYFERYTDEWDQLQLRYDTDEDGVADTDISPTPVYLLQAPPQSWGY